MSERIFDLYLDESGSFEKKGERTLVGGVLIPHEKNPSLEDFQGWENEIRSRIPESEVFSQDDLAAGDEWHELYQKVKRRENLSDQETQRYEALNNTRRYIFAHCSENEIAPERWAAQGWILREYLKKLAAIGGVPVVFDNPDGVYHIDSNTTFMSIFAGGTVKLYHALMKQYPEDSIILNIHAASRLNVTRKYEKSLYPVSPLGGKEGNLEKSLYINQINNYVFLNGGFELLNLDSFTKSMSSFDILEDLDIDGKQVPHPATVVCDYVCNCAWTSTAGRKYRDQLKESGLLHYFAFGKNPDLSEDNIAKMAQYHDWITFLKTLISKKFPERMTEAFFAGMKQDKHYNQLLCVNGLVDYLFTFINEREDMPEWIRRLNMIMDCCTPFEEEAYLNLKANLLVFKHSLQTHLGLDVTGTQEAFADCIGKIYAAEQRDYLLVLYCNRQIVTETDCFNYSKGREWFEAIRQYTVNQLKNSEELTTWFALLSGKQETAVRSIQYGKALGSYIQLLTKVYRNAAPDAKEGLKKQAEEAIAQAFEQLPGKEYSRARQNACDFFAETGEYERAMEQLYLALGEEGEEKAFDRQAAAVLERCGCFGEKGKFIYLHYVYMMHRCFMNNDPHGKILFSLIAAQPITMDSWNHLVGNQYPDAIILRHLAASMAHIQGKKTIAQKLFDYSMAALLNHGELFRTIGIAVQAEMLALGLEQKLPGFQEDWQEKTRRFFAKTYPNYCEKAKHNPFPPIEGNMPQPEPIRYLYQLADCAVY